MKRRGRSTGGIDRTSRTAPIWARARVLVESPIVTSSSFGPSVSVKPCHHDRQSRGHVGDGVGGGEGQFGRPDLAEQAVAIGLLHDVGLGSNSSSFRGGRPPIDEGAGVHGRPEVVTSDCATRVPPCVRSLRWCRCGCYQPIPGMRVLCSFRRPAYLQNRISELNRATRPRRSSRRRARLHDPVRDARSGD
jgi:hypothetical protein